MGGVDVASYDAFARFYDETQGDRAEHAAWIRSLIERHHPGAKTVLELACGTGSILKQLEARYAVTGVDLSRTMLERAAAKVPSARLVRADMTTVTLDDRFDVVLCVYDSINHLLRFRDWQAVFDRAREHLRDSGIFVFDINTQRRLAALAAAEQPLVQWFGDDNLMLFDVAARGRGVVDWRIRVFERVGDGRYRLHAEDIPETSFPVPRIKDALRKRFRRVRVLDARRARPSVNSERLHFVCQV